MTEPSEAAMQVAREIQEIYMAKLRRIYPAHAWVFPPETRFQIAQLIDREALASESGFVQHYIDALETQITTSEARNKELVEALEAAHIELVGARYMLEKQPQGCLGSVPDDAECQGWFIRDEVIERFTKAINTARQALTKHEREKTK